jgi:hypothetical protein
VRKIKIIGLIAVLAFAGLASSGIASATTLCKVQKTTCPGGETYPANTEYTGTLAAGTEATITGAAFEIKCATSTIIGKFSAASAAPLQGEITTWSFTNCEKCTSFTAIHLNYKSELEKVGGHNGNLTLKSGGGGNPEFKLTGCPLGVTCTYKAEAIGPNFVGGQPAEVVFTEASMQAVGNFTCGTEGKFSATYKITSLKEPGMVAVNNPPVYVEG